MNENLISTYRYYDQYKENIVKSPKHLKKKESVSRVISENGEFEAIRKWCDIETDWISNIENGLQYIQNAINENRQFIRSEGNVVPIERARRVSRDSTIHLAKHSELMSVHSDGTTMPEKIFIKENLSNYAVYENKFLYMAICYFRDFVDIKYKEIIAIDNSYAIDLKVNSLHSIKGKKISLKLDYGEKSTDDEYSSASSKNEEIMNRIQAIRFAISSFLNADLMIELSKTPILKPPITPTNVLKMDNDFREVYSLYTKISSYRGLGYTVNEKRIHCCPIAKSLADDLAEILLLNSFITYSFGCELETDLSSELKRCLIEEHQKLLEQRNEYILELKKKLGDGEQYLYELEGYVKSLEDEKCFWQSVATENDLFRKNIALLNKEKATLKSELGEMQKKLQSFQDESNAALEKARTEGNLELQATKSRMNNERIQMQKQYLNEIEILKNEKNSLKEELEEVLETLETVTEEKYILSARLHATTGTSSKADLTVFTTEEAFNELEKEKAAYERFFNAAWKKTKKQIRKDLLWSKGDLHQKKAKKLKNAKPEETESPENANEV